jgi:UDP-N-acetyl-D-mannosaminuronate dehydrogenase
MTKVVENYLRYRDIVVANELAAAFPGLDIAGTLRLAATKWNIGLYRPSLGIGGYCVPLAKDYLAEESDARAWLVDTVQETASRVFASARAQVVAALRGSDVAVLGVAYAANMKICTLSPSLDLVRDLVAAGIETYVADPLYTAEDLASLVDAKVATFPEVLVQVRAVVLMTAHDQFMTISDAELGVLLERCTMIIDNTGSWRQRQLPPHVRYLEVGAGQIASTALQPVSGP